MKTLHHYGRQITTALLVAAFAGSALADTPKTREQVKAELAEAVRTGDMVFGETGMKLNELFPASYPARPGLAGKTRTQVQAELAEAIRVGDMAYGESGLTLREQNPGRFPAVALAKGKTRDEVRAELAEAIRTGDIAYGESGLKLHEQFPQHYAEARRMASEAVAQRSDGAATAHVVQ